LRWKIRFFNAFTKGNIMKTSYKPLTILVAAAIGITFAASAMATEVATGSDRTSRADYRQAMKGASTDYASALQACPAAGSERSACRKDARANRDTAVADARAKHGLMASTHGDRNGAYQQTKVPN
jgi:hypothetical protein